MKEQRWFVADQMTTLLLNSSGEVGNLTRKTGIVGRVCAANWASDNFDRFSVLLR